MNRREFIKRCVALGTAAGTCYFFGGWQRLAAQAQNNSMQSPPAVDLVAIRGGEAAAMFDQGIKELGGMTSFIKRGQTVVIKPNIGWDTPPEQGATTNPALVRRVIEHCFQAGARKVYVFDHTCNFWEACYKTSGIERASKDAGALVAPAHKESYYQMVSIPGAKTLKTAKVHELVLESDVFINIPILKHHGSTTVTSALKNLMGIVWDRWEFHSTNLHRCIAEFALYRKPDLNIVDAYTVMMNYGPRGSSGANLLLKKMQVISRDIVAADSTAAKIWGIEPANIAYISQAHTLGLGVMNIDALSIQRITL